MNQYKEEDYLMLSGIQHFSFCRRQWALIHIEQQWAENVHTVQGELFHKKAHDPFLTEKRNDIIITRSMPVHSRKMGVSGFCDIVEFHQSDDGVSVFGHKGLFTIYPIEYKKGNVKSTDADILQLVAQAMCLEEMLCTEIPEGAIYYGETRHREGVMITAERKEKVEKLFEEMHQLYDRKYTPKVRWSKSCNACSLKDTCLPRLGKVKSVREYISHTLEEEE